MNTEKSADLLRVHPWQSLSIIPQTMKTELDVLREFDCIVLKNQQYRQEEFARRQRITLGDFHTWIVTREDLILSKLYWARDSKSELQLSDVRNLLSSDCDMPYLLSRAEDLGVKSLLDEIMGAHE